MKSCCGVLLVAMVLAGPTSTSVRGQSVDPRPGGAGGVAPAAAPDEAVWDTGRLLDDVEALTVEELPRLQARAENGDARSQVLLGLAHEFGSAGLARQPSEGLPWFLKAAAQGVPWAEAWAADFFMNGAAGVTRDVDRARTLYMSAGSRGDSRAAFMVGQIYFNGEGVASSMPDAQVWFERASRSGAPLGAQMADFAAVSCTTAFCTTLRQVLGAMASETAGRLVDSWDPAAREWHASVVLPGSERCGFTSTDRTDAGLPRNYFCDSAVIEDDTRGIDTAKEIAAEIAAVLPAGYTRTDRDDVGPGPSTLFRREGYPSLRVTYNRTRGSAQHRVTVLVGS